MSIIAKSTLQLRFRNRSIRHKDGIQGLRSALVRMSVFCAVVDMDVMRIGSETWQYILSSTCDLRNDIFRRWILACLLADLFLNTLFDSDMMDLNWFDN